MPTDLRLIAKQTQDFRTSLQDRKFRIGPLHHNLLDRIQQIKGKSITDIDEDYNDAIKRFLMESFPSLESPLH